jgi:hypothetical protein
MDWHFQGVSHQKTVPSLVVSCLLADHLALLGPSGANG